MQPEVLESIAPFTGLEFRRALGFFASGICIMTTLDEAGTPQGLTISSFASLSLDPPLICWSLRRDAYLHAVYQSSRHFAVNILAAEQEEVSRRFATARIDRFIDTTCAQGIAGLPLIHDSLAWLECAAECSMPGGDHTIFVGRVLRCRTFDKTPLLHWRGRYLPVLAPMLEQAHLALDYWWW